MNKWLLMSIQTSALHYAVCKLFKKYEETAASRATLECLLAQARVERRSYRHITRHNGFDPYEFWFGSHE